MKKYTSRRIGQKLEDGGNPSWLAAMRRAARRDGSTKVWDESFHPEEIYSDDFLRQKMDYIHNNPVKAGYVEDPCHWKYSSAGLYLRDGESVVPITKIDL